MSARRVVYSIQRTYILKLVYMSEKPVVTCDERIDIPTIETFTDITAVVHPSEFSKIIPCIELVGYFLAEFNIVLETNEGVTVLPVEIKPGSDDTLENPYMNSRYVLVLPRGTTGIKSCKLITKGGDLEIQHNFTFGIMPPPYNYDNALFGFLSSGVFRLYQHLRIAEKDIYNLKARVTALENKAGG